MTKPSPGVYLPPTAKAAIALMFLVKKYLPPGFLSDNDDDGRGGGRWEGGKQNIDKNQTNTLW